MTYAEAVAHADDLKRGMEFVLKRMTEPGGDLRNTYALLTAEYKRRPSETVENLIRLGARIAAGDLQ